MLTLWFVGTILVVFPKLALLISGLWLFKNYIGFAFEILPTGALFAGIFLSSVEVVLIFVN
jgi:hypothetical protein